MLYRPSSVVVWFPIRPIFEREIKGTIFTKTVIRIYCSLYRYGWLYVVSRGWNCCCPPDSLRFFISLRGRHLVYCFFSQWLKLVLFCQSEVQDFMRFTLKRDSVCDISLIFSLSIVFWFQGFIQLLMLFFRFMIIACDGLWKCFTSQEAVEKTNQLISVNPLLKEFALGEVGQFDSNCSDFNSL